MTSPMWPPRSRIALLVCACLVLLACAHPTTGPAVDEQVAPEPAVRVDPLPRPPVARAPEAEIPDTVEVQPACTWTDPAPVALDPATRSGLDDALARLVAAVPGSAVSVSVSLDGHGEILTHEPDRPLLPASTQKVFTAYGALHLLDSSARLATTVRSPALDPDRVIRGDLALVGGGDPSLLVRGTNSLDSLAAQVAGAGVVRVEGDLVVDTSRHESALTPPGRQHWQMPAYTGPLSVLMVDDNRHRTDPGFLADPNLANAQSFRDLLAARGVVVSGAVRPGVTIAPVELARVESAPISDLVGDMLARSDNEIAEQLVREIGHAESPDGPGAGGASTVAGNDRIRSLLADACLDLPEGWGDGSGLSRANFRSGRDLRRFMDLLDDDVIGAEVEARLPIAASTGTLRGRFAGTAAAGTLRAKTGTIIGGRALSGTIDTAGGRRATFGIVVNGPDADRAVGPMDRLLAVVATIDG